MTFLDKTFCASQNCKNECGRKMSEQERDRLKILDKQYVSYGYFCGEIDSAIDIDKSKISRTVGT